MDGHKNMTCHVVVQLGLYSTIMACLHKLFSEPTIRQPRQILKQPEECLVRCSGTV